MKNSLFLLLALAFLGNSGVAAEPECTATPFGAANGYNLFVLNQLRANNTAVHGRVAVAGSATVSNYSVGQKVTPSTGPLSYAFVVGNSLTAKHGSVYGGPVAIGGALHSDETFSMKHGAYKSYPVDFPAATKYLWNLSRTWAALRTEGRTVVTPGTITFAGGAHGLNVFSVSADDLARATYVKFEVPATGTVLINVTGEVVKVRDYGFELGVLGAQNIVFNFSEAKKLDLNALAVPGTVLAPFADVTFAEARIDGELIAYSVEGNGHMNVSPFAGCLPAVRN